LYSPLIEGEKVGMVSIYNSHFGEIWYSLRLTGIKSPAQKLPICKAELGKFTCIDIVLDNPSQFLIETIP
jgi:hypothetical protein